jgi:hypothetical protein
MSVSWNKLKVGGSVALSAAEIVAYVADPQAAGDYYSEADQTFLMWHTTERAAPQDVHDTTN